jgi:hypothetical protein
MKDYMTLKQEFDELVGRWHEQARLVQRMRKEEANPSDIMDAEAELGRISRQRDDVERALIAAGNQRKIAHRGRLTSLKAAAMTQYLSEARGLCRTLGILIELDRRIGFLSPDCPALGRTFIPAYGNQKATDSGGLVEYQILNELTAGAFAEVEAMLEMEREAA